MVTLLKLLDLPWEKAKGYLRLDLDAIQASLNAHWSAVFNINNEILAGAVPGDSSIDSVYVSNQGTGHTPLWAKVNLANGVQGRLAFAHLVDATQPGVLVGRRSGSAGDFEQITPGAGIVVHGTTLDVVAGGLAAQFGSAQDGQDADDDIAFPTPIIPNSILTLSTRLTAPLIVGGTGTVTPLILRSTSGVGVAGADIIFQVGTNGAVEAARFKTNGSLLMGNVTSPLGGPNTVSIASLTGQTVLRLESLTSGAGVGTFFNLTSNTGGVFDAGVNFGAVSGDCIVQTNNVNRMTFKKLDYLIGWGDLTASFPAIKRSTTVLQIRLGDDSGYTALEAESLKLRTDVILVRESANYLSLRNGTNIQKFSHYATYTDAANYRRMTFYGDFSGGHPGIYAEGLGTGANPDLFMGADRNLVLAPSNGYTYLQAPSAIFGFSVSRTQLTSPADGVLELLDSNFNNFNRLQFGGTTSAFPAIKRNSAQLQARLADDSALTVLEAAGFKFPATQIASSDANTLDDYEEGTWTPVIGGSSGTSGQTYGVQVGRYVKIGQLVTAYGYVALSAKGTISTDVQIQGLPFTSLNVANGYGGSPVGYWENMQLALSSLGGLIYPNNTIAYLFKSVAAGSVTGVVLSSAADINNNTGFIFTFTYRADA